MSVPRDHAKRLCAAPHGFRAPLSKGIRPDQRPFEYCETILANAESRRNSRRMMSEMNEMYLLGWREVEQQICLNHGLGGRMEESDVLILEAREITVRLA